jgi:hypothetical protein
MAKTANDYKMSGGFLPDFDMAEPAPKFQTARTAEDSKAWTKEEETALKKAITDFLLMPDDEKPWPLIATKCNFGHNSGSCKARWAILSSQKAAAKYDKVKSVQFGAKGAGITGRVGQFKTEVAISG